MIIDLSKFTETKTVKVGEATATLDGNTIKLEGGTIIAKNTETNKKVVDGYQPDALTLVALTLASNMKYYFENQLDNTDIYKISLVDGKEVITKLT